MNKNLIILIIFFTIIVSGCTSQDIKQYSASNEVVQSEDTANLDVLIANKMSIIRNTLFSGETTRLKLVLCNFADVNFYNLTLKLINADDLNPKPSFGNLNIIEPTTNESNNCENFEWDLTAPNLGTGEALVLNKIKVRSYFNTYAETDGFTIKVKEYGDREYLPCNTQIHSNSPITVFFDSSYETVQTKKDDYKDITVRMVFFNNYSGVLDYYDNSKINDNYVKSLLLRVGKLNNNSLKDKSKQLIFLNNEEEDSPWIKITEDSEDNIFNEFGISRSDLELYDYYYIKYKDINTIFGEDICSLDGNNPENYNIIKELSEQRRLLWMTSGMKKINILRFSIPPVSEDTSFDLYAKIIYSYSQDYSSDNFGVVVYGFG